MKNDSGWKRPLQYLLIIVMALGGLLLTCWGARAMVTVHNIGPLPASLVAFAGMGLLASSAARYYAVDFKGKGGTRAFVLRIIPAAVMGLGSMLLARALFH
ncbi:MAG TPA: hypothetical protein VIK02_02030 [Candidatus Anoxymicrobiaceae bacterium]|jgi:hypothetical protein